MKSSSCDGLAALRAYLRIVVTNIWYIQETQKSKHATNITVAGAHILVYPLQLNPSVIFFS